MDEFISAVIGFVVGAALAGAMTAENIISDCAAFNHTRTFNTIISCEVRK